MAWYCVLCIPQFLLTRGNLKLPLLRVLCLWSTSCLIKSISWLIRPLMHLYTCKHLLWNRLFSRGSHLRAANASVEDEYNGLFKITLAALFCKTCKLDIRVLLCLYNNYSKSRVGYSHFISNKGEWNNCFSKFSNRVLPPIFISTILQSVRKAKNF